MCKQTEQGNLRKDEIDLNAEAQRIAIAEACPNLFRKTFQPQIELEPLEGICSAVDEHGHEVPTVWQWWDGQSWNNCLNNDLLNDLNAMHEAEKVLTTETQWLEYIRQLGLVKPVQSYFSHLHCAVHSPANQRAEAFLRTLNLRKP